MPRLDMTTKNVVPDAFAVLQCGTAAQQTEKTVVSKLSEDLGTRAVALYQERLKNRLESTNPDDFVAIEPESGDYFLGKTLSEAIQAARTANPTNLPFALRIGHESTVELGAWAQ